MSTFILLLSLLQLAAAAFAGLPHVLQLERVFPLHNYTHGSFALSQLKARDVARHGRLLSGVVIDFPVNGAAKTDGLYYTKLQLGTPPREVYVQIDTGSDALWVACLGCSGCPIATEIGILLAFYDPLKSKSATSLSCADEKCSIAKNSPDSYCQFGTNQCSYSIHYGDGSGTSGYYVQDVISLNSVQNTPASSNSSASIVFGCSMSQTGPKDKKSFDGILGLGQNGVSVISQLASQGVAPKAFSHCFKGNGDGGGILVFGDIVDPNMVYSPLLPGQTNYNLNLQSISVNQKVLPISSTLFSGSNNNSGAVIDSGTTLVYLPEDAYNIVTDAISAAAVQSVHPVIVRGYVCYTITGSADTIFPTVSLNFAGNASMLLRPQDYMLQKSHLGDIQDVCIGFQKANGPGITIVGEVALKDKIVVYDLEGQRIGWTDYDCSSSVNVATTSSGQGGTVTVRPTSKGHPVQTVPYILTATSILISLTQALLLTFSIFMY